MKWTPKGMRRLKHKSKAYQCAAILSLILIGVPGGFVFGWNFYSAEKHKSRSLEPVLKILPQAHEESDLALINLACAEDLADGDKVDEQEAQAVLNSWASRVKSETEKYHPKFQQNPASFNNSEPYFKILTMITVLQQDCGLRYSGYHHWPFGLSQAEIQSGRYLRSLTSKEELALFLQTRGMCLKAAGRFAEAKVAWEKARQLAPSWTEHEMLIASVSR